MVDLTVLGGLPCACGPAPVTPLKAQNSMEARPPVKDQIVRSFQEDLKLRIGSG